MSYVGEVTERWEELILQPFHHFTYVTTHSPTLPSLYLCHSSFNNLSVATSQALHLRHLASRPWVNYKLFHKFDSHSLELKNVQWSMKCTITFIFTATMTSYTASCLSLTPPQVSVFYFIILLLLLQNLVTPDSIEIHIFGREKYWSSNKSLMTE